MTYRITDGKGVVLVEIEEEYLGLFFKKLKSKKFRIRKKYLKKHFLKNLAKIVEEELAKK